MIKKTRQTYLFIFLLFLGIFPYCYLSFFTQPISDDFAFASLFRTQEYFNLLKGTYLNWNGRYASNIFVYLNPISFGSFAGYKWVPFTTIFFFIIAIFLFIQQLFFNLSKAKQLIMSLLIGLLFLHNMPIISEGIYWFTGAATYQLGIIVVLLYLALLIKIIRKKKKGPFIVFLSFLLFLGCGFNEVLTVLTVFVMAVLTFIYHNKNLDGKKIITLQFILAFFFSSIIIFSPGNEFRGETYQSAHNFTHSLSYSILQTGRFSFTWIASIPLICASILYYSFNNKIKKENILFRNSFYINRWTSLLVLFIVVFICVFPAYWATGILGQHRTLNIAYFFFLLVWFINLTAWFNHFKNIKIWKASNKINLSLMLVFISGILITGNGYNALHDILSGSAKNYNLELSQRHQILNKETGSAQNKVVLPPIISKPKCLYISEISKDPNYWTNQAYNLFFKIKKKKIIIQQNTQDN
jgi:hypothetical protein